MKTNRQEKQNEKKQAPKAKPVLQCALVGCGRVARKHLKAIQNHPRAIQLCGLVDSRPEAAQKLLSKRGYNKKARKKIPVFASLEQLLQQMTPDLVAITTPSGSHFTLALSAVTAGSHVLIEKPMVLSLAEAKTLLSVAKEKKRSVAVGHIYRYFPLVQELASDLHSGCFGRVLYGTVSVRWGHKQDYYDAASWRGTWRQDGGVLMNQCVHALDLMTWLLGGTVTEAFGWIDQQIHKMEAEDLGLAILKLSNKTYCTLEGTTNTDPNRPEASFFVACTKGDIRAGIQAGRPHIQIRDHKGKNKTLHYLGRFVKRTWKQGGYRSLLALNNPHDALYCDMINAILNNSTPLADGLSGQEALAAVLAVYASAARGQSINVPSEFELKNMESFFSEKNHDTPVHLD